MGAARNNLAEVYRQTGQFAKAEPLYRRSVTILEKALGPTHPEVALALSNLALFFMTTGQYATADTLYQRSLMIFEKSVSPDASRCPDAYNRACCRSCSTVYVTEEAKRLYVRTAFILTIRFNRCSTPCLPISKQRWFQPLEIQYS